MYSLFIDTHDSNISICLYKDGEILKLEEKDSCREHSVYTLNMINDLLTSNGIEINDVKELIVVNGPGSFTGVRIGVTIAKTIAYSLNIPIKLISSLLVKAICVDGDLKRVSLVDRHGAFIATFDSNYEIVDNYRYVNSKVYEELNNENTYYNEVELDYKKIYDFVKNIEAVNPHSANPIYIKNVEV